MFQAPSQSGRRVDVQGLRAVAVLAVVAFHAGLPVPGGFAGVDVFFVISGFVITDAAARVAGDGTDRLRRVLQAPLQAADAGARARRERDGGRGRALPLAARGAAARREDG